MLKEELPEDLSIKIADQIINMCSALGISEEELKACMAESDDFNEKEWKSMKKAIKISGIEG